MTRHIGIVACSAEGAALCYRTIVHEGAGRLGVADAHPEISLHGHSLAAYVERLEAPDGPDWAGVGELMLDSARKLVAGGAEVLICPDNTIHQALPFIRDRAPAPWLHIAEVVAEEAARRGFRRIAITGTRWLTESDVYPIALEARGLEWRRPEEADRAEMGRVIMEELVRGAFSPGAMAFFQQVIGELASEGCDAVVLGCTEIPLIIDDGNSPLPTLDSTRLLARAALEWAADP
ncbi:aspartate/glutamate racemase family protein [Phenylobacterium sp.]|uniref:aspartate/glutamate racemase family protein n=1 Tax=Phenylobacterium sp. TaxID=1871053 RepID=UPI0028118DB7|nr:aspartate/glutamate racemase family protein [Phenylobacterium sp.]